MPQIEKQEREKLDAAMTAYRVFLYFTIACFLLLLPVITFWTVLADLLIIAGLVWHLLSLRNAYLTKPYDFQVRPRIIALFFVLGLLIQLTTLAVVLTQRFYHPSEEPIVLTDFVDQVKDKKVGYVIITGNDVHGLYVGSDKRFYTVLPPVDNQRITIFVDLLMQNGVKVEYRPAVAGLVIFKSLPDQYYHFALVLHVAAIIVAIVMFVLFRQFRVILNRSEIAPQTEALHDADPLGIADELRRLKTSRPGN